MELNKALKFGNLFSIYGKLLTLKQQKILSSYYFDDLGLSEISEIYGISRQAVLDTINKANEALLKFESVLNVEGNNKKIMQSLGQIQDITTDKKILSCIEEIKSLL